MQSENQPVEHRNAAPGAPADGWRVEIADDPTALPAAAWNALLARQATPTPFMRAEYLAALHASASAVPSTGWTPQFVLLWAGGELAAACPLYLKAHSYGEYVFDWAWARAYAEHGLDYYPKALVAVPFTPVPGSRLLARDDAARAALVRMLVQLCGDNSLSSLHVLYGDDADHAACEASGLMLRQQVQFHWKNQAPSTAEPFTDFEHFLASLARDKRKKIRQERRRVQDAGVTVRWARGTDISAAGWAFFYRCYERTYLEHGNAPYLTPSFFERMARDPAAHWVMFVAERAGHPIASSLIAVGACPESAGGRFDRNNLNWTNDPATAAGPHPNPLPEGEGARADVVAYGRYWGALQRVDCLHFELCYYAPLAWCIAHGVARFEGGAQGEHKMARALMPVATHSAHWLAHPGFADAVARFLAREDAGMADYLEHLHAHSPFRRAAG